MAIYSTILAWRILWTEGPGELQSPWGRKESDMTEHSCRPETDGERLGKVNHDK